MFVHVDVLLATVVVRVLVHNVIVLVGVMDVLMELAVVLVVVHVRTGVVVILAHGCLPRASTLLSRNFSDANNVAEIGATST